MRLSSGALDAGSTVAAERGAEAGWIDEAEAIRIAQGGTRLQRLRIGTRALWRLLLNNDDTNQVFIMNIALNARSLPAVVDRILSDPRGKRLADERPTITTRSVDFAALRALPSSTLGGAYARYLDDNKLDPDLFKPPPGLPELPTWIVTRVRQTHDIWHALTGYGPDAAGELALQGFTYGQLRVPSPLVLATVGTLFRAPWAARSVLDGYRRGAAADFLPVVRFEDMWSRPLDDLKVELRIRPRAS